MNDTEVMSAATRASLGPSSDLAPGDLLDGRYEIVRRIGAGGMGVVYAAKRLALGDMVAVKRLAPVSDSAFNRSRFLLEARAAAHIRHPNVVEIFDFGEPQHGAPYIVMEYLEGPTLSKLLRAGPLSVERALEIFAPVCAAVEAGHRRGIVHRDLKPSNILLAQSDDGRERAKVLDFGLAFMADGESRLTRTGAIIGTARYMSPEQANGLEALPASDVFTLGIVLYEMLTGQAPFRGKTPMMTALAISEGNYTPLDTIAPALPQPLIEAIDSALSKDPSQRPESPEQLARMAEAALPRTGQLGQLKDSRETPPPEPESLSFHHFVGRERQLRRLGEEYEAAMTGGSQLVVVVGEAGVGKTRLVERFVDQLPSGVVVLWGRFFDYAGSKPPPFESFVEMLRSSGDQASDHELRQAFDVAGIDASHQRWQMFAALTEAFARCAAGRPLILVLDDIHLATAADLELIEHLHRSLRHRGTLVVTTARESESQPDADSELASWLLRHGASRAHTQLALRPFESQEVREWLAHGLRGIVIHPRDLKRLEEATGANPYYLVEVVRHLLTTGAITWNEGWRCQPLDDVELPATVTTLVRERLRDLAPELHRTLEVAAVAGDRIRFDVLRLARGMRESELETDLDEALRRQLLREDDSGSDYRFASETLRRVLYGDMTRRRRLVAHRQVVAALYALYRSRLDRLASVLAYHHHAIGDWHEALVWGLQALAEALERSANDAAANEHRRLRDALAHAGHVPEAVNDRFNLLSGLLNRRLGHLDKAIARLQPAAEQPRDAATAVAARLELARCYLDGGDLEEASRCARGAVEASWRLGQGQQHLEARIFEASCLSRRGDWSAATETLASLLSELDEASPMALRSLAHREQAWALLKAGSFAEAHEHGRKALELARVCGDLLAHHHALSALAAVRGESGDDSGAIALHRQALELARRLSLRRREAIDLANLGEHFCTLDRSDDALENFQQALAIFVEIGDIACEGDCRVNVGRVLLASGDLRGALASLERGRALCDRTGRSEYSRRASLYEGKAHAALGEHTAAQTAYLRARDGFESIGSHYLWRADFGLARLELTAGNPDRALGHAQSAAGFLAAQRAKLPAGRDISGFERAARPVFELLAELQGGRPA